MSSVPIFEMSSFRTAISFIFYNQYCSAFVKCNFSDDDTKSNKVNKTIKHLNKKTAQD